MSDKSREHLAALRVFEPDPDLLISEHDRRLERKLRLRDQYDAQLAMTIENRGFVVIRSCFPLWHPIIRHVCGRPVMRSPEFIHLDVFEDNPRQAVQRGVPWDWVEEIWFYATRPQVAALRAKQIMSCHGIVLLSARRFLKNSNR